MKRPLLGAAALATAGALTTLTFAPAFATHTVAQADATALTISIGGNPSDSGTVTATNDGSGEQKDGTTQPPIDVLDGQDLLSIGVLAQDATAQVRGQDGYSAACSGVAGDGASVANVGDSNCLTPGQQASINVANLDLAGTVVIDPESALGALSEPVQTLLGPVLDDVTPQLADALAPLEGLDIGLNLGAIQSRCEAWPGRAIGDSTLTDVELVVGLPGQEPLLVLTLPTNPDPNTKLLTGLDGIVQMVLDAVEKDLRESLAESLAPVADLIDETAVTDVLVNEILAQIAPELAPLEENLLDGTLNKQEPFPPTDEIEVTALDLQVLPAAQEFTGSSLLSVEIARSHCGPNSRIHPPVSPEEPGTPEEPEVPTVVNSGLEGGAATPADEAAGKALVAGGLLALAGAAGALGYRRFAVK